MSVSKEMIVFLHLKEGNHGRNDLVVVSTPILFDFHGNESYDRYNSQEHL